MKKTKKRKQRKKRKKTNKTSKYEKMKKRNNGKKGTLHSYPQWRGLRYRAAKLRPIFQQAARESNSVECPVA